MGAQELLITFIAISALPSCFAQLFDFSNSSASDLKYPCGVSGINGLWKFEEASKYSGGPTEGTVFSSDISKMSCMVTKNFIQVNSNSQILFEAYVPYTTLSDTLYGWLSTGNSDYEVFKISGPTSSDNKWIETSYSLPSTIKNGSYYLEIWDTSTKHSVSFRYIEIHTEQSTTVTPSTTEATSTTPSTTEATSTTTLTTSPPDNDQCPPCSCTCSCSINN